MQSQFLLLKLLLSLNGSIIVSVISFIIVRCALHYDVCERFFLFLLSFQVSIVGLFFLYTNLLFHLSKFFLSSKFLRLFWFGLFLFFLGIGCGFFLEIGTILLILFICCFFRLFFNLLFLPFLLKLTHLLLELKLRILGLLLTLLDSIFLLLNGWVVWLWLLIFGVNHLFDFHIFLFFLFALHQSIN